MHTLPEDARLVVNNKNSIIKACQRKMAKIKSSEVVFEILSAEHVVDNAESKSVYDFRCF